MKTDNRDNGTFTLPPEKQYVIVYRDGGKLVTSIGSFTHYQYIYSNFQISKIFELGRELQMVAPALKPM